MNTKKITGRSEFESTIKSGVCLIDFNASWCAPCKAQGPIIKKLASDFEGKAIVAEADVDKNRETAVECGIRSIPTLVLYKDGKEIERFIGLQSENVLSEALEKAGTHAVN